MYGWVGVGGVGPRQRRRASARDAAVALLKVALPRARLHGAQVEQHRRLLKVDAGLLGVLLRAEGVVPGKRDGRVALRPADGEAALHQPAGETG